MYLRKLSQQLRRKLNARTVVRTRLFITLKCLEEPESDFERGPLWVAKCDSIMMTSYHLERNITSIGKVHMTEKI